MVRKLKTYQTSIGFYDLAVAAPSMKAALEMWGADSNLFHQGFAKETNDPAVVAAAVAHPGVVLRRPVGTDGAFRETSELPKVAAKTRAATTLRKPSAGSTQAVKTDDAAARKVTKKVGRQQDEHKVAQRRDEAAKTKNRERRLARIAEAQAAIDAAEQDHEARAAEFQAERDDIERREDAEQRRWEARHEKLRSALQRAKREH